MFTSKTIVAALMGAASVLAAPTELVERSTTVTASGTGTYGGYYYSNYVEAGSDSLTLGTGSYSLTWTTANEDVVAGVGWSTGAAR